MKRFIFLYTMGDDVAAIRQAVAAHVAYWEGARLDGYLGGPFADRSGGAITFNAGDLEQAAALAAGDPFHVQGLLREHQVREWLA
jgi:uncharacterized protein YciI